MATKRDVNEPDDAGIEFDAAQSAQTNFPSTTNCHEILSNVSCSAGQWNFQSAVITIVKDGNCVLEN